MIIQKIALLGTARILITIIITKYKCLLFVVYWYYCFALQLPILITQIAPYCIFKGHLLNR